MADLMDMVTTERDLLMKLPLPNLAPTPMPRLTPGTVTTGTVTGLTAMATMVDTMAIDMVTTERDLLMRLHLPNLAPTPMPRLTRGTDITVMPTGLTDMVTTVTDMATMATTERGLLMKLPLLNLAPTLMPRLTRGIPTMEDMVTALTGLTDTDTMPTDLTAIPTGDKK